MHVQIYFAQLEYVQDIDNIEDVFVTDDNEERHGDSKDEIPSHPTPSSRFHRIAQSEPLSPLEVNHNDAAIPEVSGKFMT
jgi:hypothetical protein